MGSLAPGKEGDVELMTELGWVKGKADAESLTVTSHAALEHEGSVSNDKPPSKISTTHNNSGNSKKSGKKTQGDYYSNMGSGIGAYDPKAARSNNPFFAGAAKGAASMLTGDRDHKNTNKSGKRNRRR